VEDDKIDLIEASVDYDRQKGKIPNFIRLNQIILVNFCQFKIFVQAKYVK